jgi:hypothetical protein
MGFYYRIGAYIVALESLFKGIESHASWSFANLNVYSIKIGCKEKTKNLDIIARLI